MDREKPTQTKDVKTLLTEYYSKRVVDVEGLDERRLLEFIEAIRDKTPLEQMNLYASSIRRLPQKINDSLWLRFVLFKIPEKLRSRNTAIIMTGVALISTGFIFYKFMQRLRRKNTLNISNQEKQG